MSKTHQSSKSDSQAEKPADYEVGRGKPPLHTRFKPGESGNPKGRPKGVRNFKTDVQATLRHTTMRNRSPLRACRLTMRWSLRSSRRAF